MFGNHVKKKKKKGRTYKKERRKGAHTGERLSKGEGERRRGTEHESIAYCSGQRKHGSTLAVVPKRM